MSVSVRIGGISTSVVVRRIGDAMEWWMEEPSVVLLFVPLGISLTVIKKRAQLTAYLKR